MSFLCTCPTIPHQEPFVSHIPLVARQLGLDKKGANLDVAAVDTKELQGTRPFNRSTLSSKAGSAAGREYFTNKGRAYGKPWDVIGLLCTV